MILPPAFLRRPIAHRGLHDLSQGRAENGMKAFDAAIAGGYGIELDVQRSADGAAAVFHDYHLGRLTSETGPVALRSAADLQAIALSGDGGTIPLLTQVLAHVAGRVPVLIEIKDQDGAMGPNVGPLEQAVAAALAGYDGPVAVMSFNPHSMIRMKDIAPDVPRGLVTAAYDSDSWPTLPAAVRDRLRGIPDYAASGASFVSHEAADLTNPALDRVRDAGGAILCWTIHSATEEAAARRIADNVTFEGYAA